MRDVRNNNLLYIIIGCLIVFTLIMSYVGARRDFVKLFIENDNKETELNLTVRSSKYVATFYKNYSFEFSKINGILTLEELCDKKDLNFKNICKYYNGEEEYLFTENGELIRKLDMFKQGVNYNLITDVYDYYVSKLSRKFTFGSYVLYSYECEGKENTKELFDIDCEKPNYYIGYQNKIYNAEEMANSNGRELYSFKIDNNYGIVDANKETSLITSEYDRISCKDDTSTFCGNKLNTIIRKETKDTPKFGIASMNDKCELDVKINLEYDGMNYIDNDNYIVKKNNKYGVININKKVLLAIDNDFVGYNKDIGYVTIKGGTITIYDNNFNEKSSDLKKLYDDNIDKQDYNYILLSTANSYYENSDSYLIYYDINSTFTKEGQYRDIQDYIKYTDKKYDGEQLFIFDSYNVCKKKTMYIINDDKAELLSENKIIINERCSEEE